MRIFVERKLLHCLHLAMLFFLLVFSGTAFAEMSHEQVQQQIISRLYNGAGGHMNTDYGPYTGKYAGSFHQGFDFAIGFGTPVYSILSGEVTRCSPDKNGNTYICIYNKEADLTVVYMHTDKILVERPQKVSAGQQLAVEASRGKNSTGPHTHVEFREGYVTSAATSIGSTAANPRNPDPYVLWNNKIQPLL